MAEPDPDPATGKVVELRAKDIDPSIQVAGTRDQLETVLYSTLHADTAGGIVEQNNHSNWSLPARPQAPLALDGHGAQHHRRGSLQNEFLEFWVFQGNPRTADSADVQMVIDLGSVNEDALAIAPEMSVAGPTFSGRQGSVSGDWTPSAR